jgi:xylulokinase
MNYLMGIDLGTSSLKVVILDEQGAVKAEASQAFQFDSPYTGWAEQQTEDWWQACKTTLKTALAQFSAPADEIRAVSFCGQMHGLIALNKDYAEVRPAILHCDARSSAQVRRINAVLAEKGLAEKQYNAVYTGFLLTSLLWLRENEPANYARLKHVCLPKDFLKFKLSGELCCDYSDASSSMAFDIEKHCWADDILDALDMPRDIFPPCYASDYVAGKVSAQAAAETGLSRDTLIVNGGGDIVMQSLGCAAIGPGQAVLSIGSAGQVCFQSDKPVRNPGLSTNTFCGYSDKTWITMGATITAGLCLKWVNGLIADGSRDFSEIDTQIEGLPPGSGGILFLPYLNGERTPYINSELSGAFLGLTLGTGRAHLARAVMEGITFSLCQCLEVCGALGFRASELIVSGGAAKSPVWLQMQADIYNMPLKTTVMETQANFGAAAMAGKGAGLFTSIKEACRVLVRYKEKVWIPDAERRRVYADYYGLFKEAYTGSAKVLVALTKKRRERQAG